MNVFFLIVGPVEVPSPHKNFTAEDWVLLDAMGCSPAPGASGRFLTMHKRRRKKLTTRSLNQDIAILDDIHHGQVQVHKDHKKNYTKSCVLYNCFLLVYFLLENFEPMWNVGFQRVHVGDGGGWAVTASTLRPPLPLVWTPGPLPARRRESLEAIQ